MDYSTGCPVLGLCETCASQAVPGMRALRPLRDSDAQVRAVAVLAQQRVRAMLPSEEAVFDGMRRHWDAFALLFNPAVTL